MSPMPLCAALLCAVACTAWSNEAAENKANQTGAANLRVECRKPGSLTAETRGNETILSISGDGIGRAKVTPTGATWPQRVVIRARLRGLESLTIDNGRTALNLSVPSHGGHVPRLHLRDAGKEGPDLTKDSAFWTTVRRLDADGKEVGGLPPEGGCFEIEIPRALLAGGAGITLDWIDFYRG